MKRVTLEEADALTREELAKDDAHAYPVALCDATYESISSFEHDAKIRWTGDGWYEIPTGKSSRFIYVAGSPEGLRAVTYHADPREALHRVALAPVQVVKNAQRIAELREMIAEAKAELKRLEGGA
jgi:hypothetical protein